MLSWDHMSWLLTPPPSTPPPPPPRQQVRQARHRKTKKKRQLVAGRGGGGSLIIREAWSSIIIYKWHYIFQYCGSGMFIPYPNFFHPVYRIRIKEFRYLNPKIVSKLSEIWSWLFIPDPGVKKAPDPGSGSATQHWYICCCFQMRVCIVRVGGWAGWGRRRQQQRLVVCRRVETWKTASRPVGVRPPKKVVRRRSFLGGNRNNSSSSNSVPFHPPGAVYYCVLSVLRRKRRKNGQHRADTRPITR